MIREIAGKKLCHHACGLHFECNPSTSILMRSFNIMKLIILKKQTLNRIGVNVNKSQLSLQNTYIHINIL